MTCLSEDCAIMEWVDTMHLRVAIQEAYDDVGIRIKATATKSAPPCKSPKDEK